MAPRTTMRARSARSANKDPRGSYAPLPDSATLDQDVPVLDSTTATSALSLSRAHDDNSAWRLNKRDKRTIRHNTLLSRVRDSGVQKSGSKTLKRRRPNNKLKTNLDGLVDALPDTEVGNGEDDDWEGLSEDELSAEGEEMKGFRRARKAKTAAAKPMVMKSMRSRPGAMKRKQKLEGLERDRFQKNLAQILSTGNAASGAAPKQTVTTEGARNLPSSSLPADDHANRWAALRNFIGQTMEPNQMFAAS